MKKAWSLTSIFSIILVLAFMLTTGAQAELAEMECNKNLYKCPTTPATPVTPDTPKASTATIPDALAKPAVTNAPVAPTIPAAPTINEDLLASKISKAVEDNLKDGLAKLDGRTAETAKATEEVKKNVGVLKKSVDKAVGTSKFWATKAKELVDEAKKTIAAAIKTAEGLVDSAEKAAGVAKQEADRAKKEADRAEKAADESKKHAKNAEDAAGMSFWFMVMGGLILLTVIGAGIFFLRKIKKASSARSSDKGEEKPAAEDLWMERKIKELERDLENIGKDLATRRKALIGLNKESPEAKNIQAEIGELVGKQVNAEEELEHLKKK